MPTLYQHMTLIRLRRKQKMERLKICGECPYAKRLLGAIWCGTPVVGRTIDVRGKKVKLCGCNMDIKAKLDSATCPLKKW